MQEPSDLGKITQVSIWFTMVLTQIITRVCKYSHLVLPTRYQHLTGIKILIPTSGFFYTIIDTMHSLIYQTNIGQDHRNLVPTFEAL